MSTPYGDYTMFNPPLVVSGSEFIDGKTRDFVDALAVAFTPLYDSEEAPYFLCDYLVVLPNGQMCPMGQGCIKSARPLTPSTELSPSMKASPGCAAFRIFDTVDVVGVTKDELVSRADFEDREVLDEALDYAVRNSMIEVVDDLIRLAPRYATKED